MRGSPLWRAVIVFAVLLALGPLLWRLTRPDATAGAAQATAAQPAAVTIRVTFSHPARKVTLLHLGNEVWSKTMPATEEEGSFNAPWPREGIELRALVDWQQGGNPSAMRLRLTDPAGNEYDRTVWGADEVLTFP
jgi:hypothetical protein